MFCRLRPTKFATECQLALACTHLRQQLLDVLLVQPSQAGTTSSCGAIILLAVVAARCRSSLDTPDHDGCQVWATLLTCSSIAKRI
eukprot:1159892-Pelagomonas_calceolata.AAC.8